MRSRVPRNRFTGAQLGNQVMFIHIVENFWGDPRATHVKLPVNLGQWNGNQELDFNWQVLQNSPS